MGQSLSHVGFRDCDIPDNLIIDLVSRNHIEGVHITEMSVSAKLFAAIVNNQSVYDIILDDCTFPDNVFNKMKLGPQVRRFNLRNSKQSANCIEMLLYASSLS